MKHVSMIGIALLAVACVQGKSPPSSDPGQDIPLTDEDTPPPGDISTDESIEDIIEIIPEIPDAPLDATDTPPDPGKDTGPAGKVKWVEIGLPFPKDYVFKSISGSSATDVFIAGAGPIAYHYDGVKFADLAPPSPPVVLNAVGVVGAGDAWMAGMGGARLHYNGVWEGIGCKVDSDCESPGSCLKAVCKGGECQYEGDPKPGCCGFPSLDTGFDDGTPGGFEVADLYAGQPDMGGIVWNVASHVDAVTAMPRYTSAPYALYFGIPDKPCPFDPTKQCPDFDNGKTVGSTATSPEFTVPSGKSATLTFSVFIDTESGMSFDVFRVKAIKTGGIAEDVWTKDQVGGVTNKSFAQATADLTKYMGQAIRLQWHFDSADPIANQTEGIYVDDIEVTTECGAAPKPVDKFPTLYGISGSAPDNVYAVGAGGTVLKHDGKSWKTVGIKGPVSFRGICSDPASGLWVVGSGGTVVRMSGQTFSAVESGIKANLFACGRGMVAAGAKGAMVAGDASGLKSIPSVTFSDLQGVAAIEGGTAWAVGGSGAIVKYSGGQSTMLPVIADGADLFGAFATSTKDIWAVGEGAVAAHFNGLAWSTTDTGAGAPLYSIHGWTAGSMLAVGMHGAVMRYKDNKWESLKSGTDSDLRGVVMVSETDGWAVGTAGTIVRFKGNGTMEKVESPTKRNLWAVTLDPAGTAWAAGDGVVLRRDADAWKVALTTLDTDLRAVFTLDQKNVFVAGKGGTILAWDGANFVQQEVEDIPLENGGTQPFTSIVYGVWARAAGDAWAVSEAGTWLRLEGKTWKVYGSGEDVTLRGVSGTPKTDVWMVGGAGTILHFGTSGLTREATNPIATLYGVYASKDGQVFAVGDTGTVLKRIKE